ncbi:MAG: cell division protein ZapA [Bryobacteraceae bacterium]
MRVTILNQVYNVATTGDPEETIQTAHEVDELMSTIARRGGNLDSTRTAVLACLHLADKLRDSETKLNALRELADQRSRSLATLLHQLDAELEPSAPKAD